MLKIAPTNELLESYQLLQLRKKKQKGSVKWMTCEIKGDKIIIDKSMSSPQLQEFMDDKKIEDVNEASHKVFTEVLTECNDHRYGIIDYKDKVFFVSYISDSGPAKTRMIYATVRQSFKESLSGVNADVQATDPGDLAVDVFDKKCPQS